MAINSEILATFRALLDQAQAAGEPEPTAMTLATADTAGRVSARIVLLKAVDEQGFMFVTHYDSLKGRQLTSHNRAALCFLWKMLRNQVQVRIEGRVERVSDEESDSYFASRSRCSQIGAWASRQSEPLSSRAELEEKVAEFEQKFIAKHVPRPPCWGGLRLVPDLIEFWYGAAFRLHDRVRYQWQDGEWKKDFLYP